MNKLRFTVKPYDPFFTNKTMKGQQFAIFWHIDYLKLYHADPEEAIKIISWIVQRYYKVRIIPAKNHNYLGIYLDYSTPGGG